MKVLVVHNRYRSQNPSGENSVVDDEVEALRHRGVEVVPYIRSSDEIDNWSGGQRLSLPVSPIYSRQGVQDVRRLIAVHHPDVLHLHNPFPLISPVVVRVGKNAGIPVVQTVHNHRHVCMKGTYYRDEHLCHDCLGRRIPWPGIVHGCYQGSKTRSAPMAVALIAHRGTWQRIDRFLALSPHIADHLVTAGIREDVITVRPNTVEDPGEPNLAGGSGVVFAGRLEEDKGVKLLLDAWCRHPANSLGTLTLLGDGPLRSLAEQRARARCDIRVLGLQDKRRVADEMRAAAVVAVPSKVPEAFPRVVVEAFSHGTPVLATDVGGLPRIVTEGVGIVVTTDVDGVSRGLSQLSELSRPSTRAAVRTKYEALYSPDVVYGQLLAVYQELTRRRPSASDAARDICP